MSMALYIYSFFGAPTMFVIAVRSLPPPRLITLMSGIQYKTWKSYNAPSLRQIFPAGSPSSTSKSRPMRQPAYTGLNAPPQSYAAMLRAVRVNTVVQVEVDKAEEELEMDDKGPARLRVGVLAPEDRALERVKEQMDAYFVPCAAFPSRLLGIVALTRSYSF